MWQRPLSQWTGTAEWSIDGEHRSGNLFSFFTTPDDFIREADNALYRAKRQGGIVSKHKTQALIVTAAVIFEKGKVLVTQRREASFHRLLWEFPGGKVRANEEPREALQRELREELGVEARVGTSSRWSIMCILSFPSFFWCMSVSSKEEFPNPWSAGTSGGWRCKKC